LNSFHCYREELYLLWKKWDKSNSGPLLPLDATQVHLPSHLFKTYRYLWYSFDGLSVELGRRLKKGWAKTPYEWRRILMLAATEWLWDSGDHAYATLNQWGEVCRKHCGESALKVVNGTLRAFLRSHENSSELTILKFLPKELIKIWSFSSKPESELIEWLKAPRQQFYFPLDQHKEPSSELMEKIDFPWMNLYQLRHGVEPQSVLQNESGFFQNIHAAELAHKIMILKRSGNMLDYCAAPGGKSWQMALAQRENFDIYMHESNPRRAEKIVTSPLLNHFKQCIWLPKDKLKEMSFDNILVDVPCSNSGVLIKNPEACRHLWHQNDDCVEVQNEILNMALSMLKEGGRIFYSTCSINPLENHGRVQRFCEERAMQLVEERQWWPESKGGHGAYLACIE